MSQLAFYCATESRHLSIINGSENGGSVTDIRKAVPPHLLSKLNKNYHVFLDNLSGDIFGYD